MKAAALPLLGLLACAASAQEPWRAPEPARSRANPVPAADEAVRKGRALYQRNCASCHGAAGKGDGSAMRAVAGDRRPRDLGAAEVQASMSDGEIFWKLSSGLKEGSSIVMPGFAAEIPKEDDRWKLVLYVRSLARR